MFERCNKVSLIFCRYYDLIKYMIEFIDYCEERGKTYGFVKQVLDNWSISLENYEKECEKNEKI